MPGAFTLHRKLAAASEAFSAPWLRRPDPLGTLQNPLALRPPETAWQGYHARPGLTTVPWGKGSSGRQTAARKSTFSRWLASLCRGGRGYKHPVLDRPQTKGHVVLPEDVSEAFQTSNRAFWASDCIPMCKMRLQSEAPRSIPTNRSCRFCDPVSGRCRGLCVQPCSPKSGRETPQRHYRTMSFAQAPSRPTP
jgi:hypothetical protein